MSAGLGAAGRRPLLSAVLCTRNGAVRLRRVLESLCAQTLAREAFEVVVVDDGSTDGTRQVVRAFEGRLPLRDSRQRPAGTASARNHGLLCARGAVVLFLDDDLAEAGLLEKHLAAHRRFPEPRYAVLGRARLDAAVAGDPLMQFAAEAGWPPFDPALPRAGEAADFRHVAAGRSSWKRAFLLDHGLFDPALRSGAEGADLALRLAPHGLELVVEPGATSVVAERLSLDEICARLEREGRARRRVAERHAAPAVQRWAGLVGGEGWDAAATPWSTVIRSARELDRLARARLEERLPLEDLERGLLHRSYLAAFRASRTRGAAEAALRAST